MEPPIIAWEPNDMTVYPTIEEAEADIEPWMCAFLSIFDRRGRRLVLEEGGRSNTLREIEPGKKDEAGLRTALLQYLRVVEPQHDLSNHSTDELIALASRSATIPEPRYGVVIGFVIDLVRAMLGKKPLHTLAQPKQERGRPIEASIVKPRLATFEQDGWQLRSAEESHTLDPETFWIPSLEKRQSLRRGEAAKLMFDVDAEDEGGVVHRTCERMWVIVRERLSEFYLGVLGNQPASVEPGTGPLNKGTEVFFKPEHVIDTAQPPPDYVDEVLGSK